MGIIGIKGTLRFYWRRMMYACKSLVEIIWNWYIDSFLIMIPFQLNSTENFTIPINSDIVVFLMCLLDGHHCDFQQFWIQSCQQQDWMFLVVWGDEKVLVCGLWVNSIRRRCVLLVLCNQNGLLVGDCRCMFYIHLIHNHFGKEFLDFILLWCLQV